MSRGRRARFPAASVLLALLASGPARAAGAGPDVRAQLDRLDRRSAEVETILASLEAAGEEAALLALESFDGATLEGRRARAELVSRVASPACLGDVLARLGEPDPVLRATWVRFLGKPTLGREAAELRLARLGELLVVDPDHGVREAARESLTDCALPEAAGVLDAALDELPAAEAAEAAQALVELTEGRRRLVRRVLRSLGDDGAATAGLRDRPSLLAALLEGYGRALAELPAGGEEPAERAPFRLGSIHPDPGVRRAALLALESFGVRLVERDELDRADRFLAALVRDGFDPDPLRYRRARLALARRGDPALALELADELDAGGGAGPGVDAAVWRLYARLFRGAARLALGDPKAAREAFLEGEALCLDLVEGREDVGPDALRIPGYPAAPRAGELQADRFQLAAVCRLWLALADRRDPPLQSIEHVRQAHAYLLRSQALAFRTDVDVRTIPWDVALDHDLGPSFLLLANRELAGWDEGHAVELELFLGRLIATIAPREMPGFEPFDELPVSNADPVLDPLRRGLLTAIAAEDLLHWRRYAQDPSQYERSPEEQRRQRIVARVREDEAQRALGDPDAARSTYRSPSELARRLADVLRADGRPEEARRLSERMLEDLAALDGVGPLYQEWASARIQLSIASSWMDEDRPVDAENAALDAVRRLESLRTSLKEEIRRHEARGDVGAEEERRNRAYLEQTETLLANALLSLAVNANVRLKDTEKALRYFERAYEYDQSEFMEVLLACYRARSGRGSEARAILARIDPAPALYYNLACTWALLGEADRALDYLQREFAENHPTEAGRRQQQAWARDDPDLASLRGDPRFERIVGAAD